MPDVAVFQIAVAKSAIGSGAAGGDIVIDPKRKVRTETSSADNGESVGGKEVRSWRKKTVSRDKSCRLLTVPVEISLVPESNGQEARNLARVYSIGQDCLLQLRAVQHWRIFHEVL